MISVIDFLKNIFKDIELFYSGTILKGIAEEIVTVSERGAHYLWKMLIKIKKIGRYIASDILCFGFNKSYAILDTNVIGIFKRLFEVKSEKRHRKDDGIWQLAQMLLLVDDYVSYNYAILDFVAQVCTAICIFKFICSNINQSHLECMH